ncbi:MULTISPECIES: hypothetical protein [Vibrionaceae]|uniref:Uncharacterized protein n=1 Tax=Vibrio anguillarum TaxID=55601 RepID=A0A7U6FUF7_VIBAN|nr:MULTISPECIES: hypothetical protein [Vibrionaceae]AZS27507.1 hypothetical protein DYL72_21590 [Vibrio anguillarum]AZS27548.1 hypothetical protein DYL72_21805 [Vibrio anguillarum]PSB83987.1 hypothetical protein C5F62_07015 [Photobacterium damselae subsp. damselae]UXH30822.1 hypothetical protein N5E84_21155 [Vibrio sp. J502]
MSKTLDKIRKLIAEASQSLEQLKPKSLSATELDKVTRERAMLRDKLELLREQEEIEVSRIQEEEAVNKADRRKLLLMGLAEAAKEHKNNHEHLNEKITTAIAVLIQLVKERDEVVGKFGFGDRLGESRELLEPEEFKQVSTEFRETRYARQSETSFIPDLVGCWYQELRKQVGTDENLYQNLSRFVSMTREPKEMQTIGDQMIELCEDLLNPPEVDEVEELNE